MQLSQPFVRLPFDFDARRLAQEVAQFSADEWMAHPLGQAGNSALPLVARDGGNNDEFDGRMLATAHLERCPYVRQAMAAFGEVVGRSRLMRLDSGCEVSAHVDFNYHWHTRVRIHIPVVTNPDVTFYCGDQHLHMHAGECWIFDSWRRHNVVNRGREDRVHLVIDTAGSARFWRTVRQVVAAGASAAPAVREVPFEPGLRASLQTERYNTSPVMAPGELDGLVRELVADFTANAANDADLSARYVEMLDDLRKDWREIWHLHGERPAGWPHYRTAIATVTRGLAPQRRALLTSSNGVGVNPVIVQRILRAALREELAVQEPPGSSAPDE